MEIELSEDLQHYKESLVLGLTAKQFLFSALALGVGMGLSCFCRKNRDYFELLCGNPFCCTSGTDWVL